jgi:hypothetical protein
MNPASGSTRAPASDDESSTEAGSDDNADFTLLPPAQPGQRFIDGPLDMIGAGR